MIYDTEKDWQIVLERITPLLKLATVDEFVEFFETYDYKGCPGKPSVCPLANYLSEDLKVLRVSVCITSIVSRDIDYPYKGRVYSFTFHSLPLATFITRFDAGKYPELVSDD